EKVVLAVGNVEGIARVEDRLEGSNPQPEARYYTVVKGDTLSKIARAQYGEANKYPQIFEANKPMLKDPDKIYPGQVLRIPRAAPNDAPWMPRASPRRGSLVHARRGGIPRRAARVAGRQPAARVDRPPRLLDARRRGGVPPRLAAAAPRRTLGRHPLAARV